MLIKRIKQLAIIALSLSFTTAAHATASGPYFGIQVGMSDVHNTSRELFNGTTFVPVNPNNSGFGGRLLLGYNYNPYVAAELGLTHYGPSTYNKPTGACGSSPQIHENSFEFLAKGMFPFFDAFDAFAKAGISIMSVSSANSLVAASPTCAGKSGNTTNVRPVIALGASYYASQSLVLDLTYSHVLGGGVVQNADLVAIGITYHFVDKYCGQFLC